jgi:hypothetical protein
MAAATVWLAVETRRMAVATKASIDLLGRPYLAFRGVYLNIGSLLNSPVGHAGAIRLGVRLYNPGKVLVYYHVPQMTASFGGHVAADLTFDSRGGVIHPEEEITYFYPLISSPLPLVAPAEGQVEFQVSFWSVPTERKTLRAKLRVTLTSATTHEWKFLEGPSYA